MAPLITKVHLLPACFNLSESVCQKSSSENRPIVIKGINIMSPSSLGTNDGNVPVHAKWKQSAFCKRLQTQSLICVCLPFVLFISIEMARSLG